MGTWINKKDWFPQEGFMAKGIYQKMAIIVPKNEK